MDTTAFTFDRRLYRDKATNRLTFEPGPGRPLAIREGITLTLEALLAFMSRYGPVDPAHPEKLFAPDVEAAIKGQGVEMPDTAAGTEPETVLEAAAPAALAPAPPVVEAPPVEEAPALEAPPVPPTPTEKPLPPSEKVRSRRHTLRSRVFDRIRTEAGLDAFIEGHFDDAVQDLVCDICTEVLPRQVLTNMGDEADRVDHPMDTTLSSQAFGSQLDLDKEDLFLIAKSAILNSLNEADRENIAVLKRNLLSQKPSTSFRRRLEHYYREVHNYLRSRGVDAAILDVIDQSIYVYFDEPVPDILPQAKVLGVADAFVTLKESGLKVLRILEILPARLERVLGEDGEREVESVRGLLLDSCYNEFRRSIARGLSGGDHCDFFRVAPGRFGLLIFDVSGHGARASKLRDALVTLLERIRDKSDAGVLATRINNFLLRNNCPEDMFVSFLYGIIDIEENRFQYVNAGHNPPYRVHAEKIIRLDQGSELLLNIAPVEYRTRAIPLAPRDCLVLYTDGITEAKRTEGEMFGEDRLQDTIGRGGLARMKAKDVVRTILACVHDEGFEIQDDVTIQVYRHI